MHFFNGKEKKQASKNKHEISALWQRLKFINEQGAHLRWLFHIWHTVIPISNIPVTIFYYRWGLWSLTFFQSHPPRQTKGAPRMSSQKPQAEPKFPAIFAHFVLQNVDLMQKISDCSNARFTPEVGCMLSAHKLHQCWCSMFSQALPNYTPLFSP